MKVGGIVAEYNPFHLGHAHLIECARAAGITHTVAVMSGSFVQRGDAAVCGKRPRCEMALACGVDLVLELPLPYAVATAQRFALGAVGTLHALGIVDELFFGSECGETSAIERVASVLESEPVVREMRRRLKQGQPFAAARQEAVTVCGAQGGVLRGPNDTLAVEYTRAVQQLGSGMKVHAVRRLGAAHDGETAGGVASASVIRQAIRDGQMDRAAAWMPEAAASVLRREIEQKRCPADLSRLETALLALLRQSTVEELASLPDISEGLENRLYRAVREETAVSDILERVKSKRYTHARLRRILLYRLLGVTRELYDAPPVYLRVLGMNERGREILAASRPTLPLITRAKDAERLDGTGASMLRLECAADDLYALTLPQPVPCGATLRDGIVIR